MEKVVIGKAELYLGNCLELLPELSGIDAIISDPPYGIKYNPKRQRKSTQPGRNRDNWESIDHQKVTGDDAGFDPRPFLFAPAILWGANNYAHYLPPSNGWLFWDKKKAEGFAGGAGEFAWSNIVGSPKRFLHMWDGFRRDSENGKHYHPTQKPVALMKWCIELAKNPATIFDPYMGSGTTGVAAVDMGLRFVGCEIERGHFDIACRRIEEAQGGLF